MSTLKLSFIGLGGKIAITIFGLLNTVLLARWLGPSGFGSYVVFVRVVSVLTMVGDFGQAQSATSFFGLHQAWSAHLYRVFFRVVMAASIITSIVAGGILLLAGDALLPGFPRAWMFLVLAVVPLSVYGNFWNGMMIGRGAIWGLNVVRTISSLLFLLCTGMFVVLFSGGLGAAILGFSGVLAAQAVLMMVLAWRMNRRSGRGDPPADLTRQVVSFGMRGYGSVVFYTVWTAVPLFVLNALHGAAAAGVFSIAQQLVEKLLLPVQAVQEAIYRQMSSLAGSAATAMNRYLGATVWGTCLAVALGMPAAAWGIPVLFGEEYSLAGRVTVLLLIGTPFMAALMVIDPYFIAAERRPGMASLLAGVNVVVASALALLLIPTRGPAGAAVALVLTQCAGAFLALLVYLKLSRSEWRQVLWMAGDDIARIRARAETMTSWNKSRG